jgi:hypothetical protein
VPVKRRHPKRRTTAEAELAAWSMLFEGGHDYFNALGFGYGNDAEAREAAPDAWRRLGAAFLAARPENAGRAVPWALDALGEPRCR